MIAVKNIIYFLQQSLLFNFSYTFRSMRFGNRLSDGHKMAVCIIALNTCVFLLWKVPSLTKTMLSYFSASPNGGRSMLILDYLKCYFSHV